MADKKENFEREYISWLLRISLYSWSDSQYIRMTVKPPEFIDMVNKYQQVLAIENEEWD